MGDALLKTMKTRLRLTAIILILAGAIAIIADVANFFPTKSGAYAITGAVLIAAGVLVFADN